MHKTFKLHLWMESELIDKLKAEAKEMNLNLAECCRQKLRSNSSIDTIKQIVIDIQKTLNTQLNFNGRCKNG